VPIPPSTVSAAPGPRTRLGALLLRKGLVSPVELEDALEAQRTKGGLLGEILVRSGLASRPAIEDALAEQVGRRVEFEAGFGTGLRSQIASRRPRRGSPVARTHTPAPLKAVAVAPAPHPVLEAVPDQPEQEEPEELAVVHALPIERDDEPNPAAELAAQAEHWERIADELREERDSVRHVLAARDRALAEAYAQIEEAAERLVASERARTDAEDTTAELEELRGRLDAERAQREQAEDEAAALRTDLVASEVELRLARDELEEARREPEPVLATEHVVFVRSGARYVLVAADGPPPQPGTRLELDERDYLVLKVGRSPFPGDDRPCAFAEPA
jgi:hypothetical protein